MNSVAENNIELTATIPDNGIPKIGQLNSSSLATVKTFRKGLTQKILTKLDGLAVKELNPTDATYLTAPELFKQLIGATKVSEFCEKFLVNAVGTQLSLMFKRHQIKRTSKRVGNSFGYFTKLALNKEVHSSIEDREKAQESADADAKNKENAVVIIESLIGSLTDHEAHHVFYLLHTEVEERRKALEAKLNKLQGLNAHAIETLGVVSELAKELEV